MKAGVQRDRQASQLLQLLNRHDSLLVFRISTQ